MRERPVPLDNPRSYFPGSRCGFQGSGGACPRSALTPAASWRTSIAETCCGCLGCVQVCPYGAINYMEDQGICQVNKVLCKGCGGCAATCPSASARLDGFSRRSDICANRTGPSGYSYRRASYVHEQFEPTIIGFLCNWCAYAGSRPGRSQPTTISGQSSNHPNPLFRNSGTSPDIEGISEKARTAFLSVADTSVIAITCTVIT